MPVSLQKGYPGLKHGGFCAIGLLPGENRVEFNKLHRELISLCAPDDPLQDDVVATLSHLLWRKKHLSTIRLAGLARQRASQIRDEATLGLDLTEEESSQADDFKKQLSERLQAAEAKARHELGDFYQLAEMADEATLEGLSKDLELYERLDAMMDRCVKRLLLLKGLESITAPPIPPASPNPSDGSSLTS